MHNIRIHIKQSTLDVVGLNGELGNKLQLVSILTPFDPALDIMHFLVNSNIIIRWIGGDKKYLYFFLIQRL